MKKVRLLPLLLLLSLPLLGQSHKKSSIREPMYRFLVETLKLFPSQIEEGEIDYANGYGVVEDDTSTYTIAGYKDARGGFTFLATEGCYALDEDKIISNRPLAEILPRELSFADFAPGIQKLKQGKYAQKNPLGGAPFYLVIDPPKRGTDTRIRLVQKPFNYFTPSPNYFSINEKGKRRVLDKILYTKEILKTPQHYEMIRRGEAEKIAPETLKELDKMLKDQNFFSKICIYGREKDDLYDAITSLKDLQDELGRLYEIYLLSSLVTHDVILGWDREHAKFFIKERVPKEKTRLEKIQYPTFYNFILKQNNTNTRYDHRIEN